MFVTDNAKFVDDLMIKIAFSTEVLFTNDRDIEKYNDALNNYIGRICDIFKGKINESLGKKVKKY